MTALFSLFTSLLITTSCRFVLPVTRLALWQDYTWRESLRGYGIPGGLPLIVRFSQTGSRSVRLRLAAETLILVILHPLDINRNKKILHEEHEKKLKGRNFKAYLNNIRVRLPPFYGGCGSVYFIPFKVDLHLSGSGSCAVFPGNDFERVASFPIGWLGLYRAF